MNIPIPNKKSLPKSRNRLRITTFGAYKSIDFGSRNEVALAKERIDTPLKPRAILYIRVSTGRQLDRVKSRFDSHQSQERALREYCTGRGYDIVEVIREVGNSRDLNRPGIERVRSWGRAGLFEVLLSVRTDRLAGGDDFPLLKRDLQRQGVTIKFAEEDFDTETAEGDLLSGILTKTKEHTRRVTGEKVKRVFRQRSELEMYSNGKPPFGFLKRPREHTLKHDPRLVPVVQRMFEVYLETRSDFGVRDWLKAQGILSPKGEAEWSVGSIRDVLQNVRYAGYYELNRKNKGRPVLSPDQEYQCLKAKTYEPMVPKEVFDLAQQIRREQAQKNPRPAKPRVRPIKAMTADDVLNGDLRGSTNNISDVKSNHVFLLQGLIFCPVCGHPMSPHYVEKKPNPDQKRRSHSYVNYYECSLLRKHPDLSRKAALESESDQKCGRVLASRVERWAIQQVATQVRNIHMVRAVETAMADAIARDVKPVEEALAATKERRRELQREKNELIESLPKTGLNEAVIKVLNEKVEDYEKQDRILAAEIEQHRETLESQRFTDYRDTLHEVLDNFQKFARYAKPQELQQILRLFIHRITCDANGVFQAEFFRLHLPEEQFPGLLQRNSNGELEWAAAGSRVPWEFMRFKNRIEKKGDNRNEQSNNPEPAKERHQRRQRESSTPAADTCNRHSTRL